MEPFIGVDEFPSAPSFAALLCPDFSVKLMSSRIGVPPARAVRLRTTRAEPRALDSRAVEGKGDDIENRGRERE